MRHQLVGRYLRNDPGTAGLYLVVYAGKRPNDWPDADAARSWLRTEADRLREEGHDVDAFVLDIPRPGEAQSSAISQ